MEQLQFTKRDTGIAKGVFLLMMLVHHLFYDYDTFANYNVTFFILSPHQVIVMAQYFKLCIAGFTMLTFYGMTKKYMEQPTSELTKQMMPITIRRLTGLVLSFLFLYVIAAVVAVLLKEDLTAVYSVQDKSRLGYALIDAFGMADFFHTPTMNLTWWYMSFAIVILILFPFFYKLYEKFGMMFVLLAAMLPGALLMEQTYYGLCACSMALGILAAKTDLFVRLRRLGYGSVKGKAVKAVVCCIVFVITYQLLFYSVSVPLYFGIGAVLWTYICYEFITPLKWMNQIIGFIGKHSFYIFLTHTFLYYYYAKDYIYGFHYGILIVIVLLISSMLIALLLEGLQQITGYNRCKLWMQDKLAAGCMSIVNRM